MISQLKYPQTKRESLRFAIALLFRLCLRLCLCALLILKVIVNFTSNALKFTPAERCVEVFAETGVAQACCDRMHVDLKPVDRSQLLHVRVIDQGIGISDENISKLFQPFFQVSKNSTEGSGLGLHICMELSRLLGGHVCCRSKLGYGSTFTFIVPILVIPKAAKKSGSACGKKSTEDERMIEFLKSERILVAEDNRVNQMVISNMLKQLGCTFDIANNGKEACEMFEERDYFLVLMDLMMPVMDGFEATRRICDSPKFTIRHPLVVALTASVTEAEVNQARNSGCSNVLSKPISRELLDKAIHDAAHRRMDQIHFAFGSRRNLAVHHSQSSVKPFRDFFLE